MNTSAVVTALRESWEPDTCAPEDVADWTPENPAREQCATTAVVLHDYFGGCLVRGEVIVDGRQVDSIGGTACPTATRSMSGSSSSVRGEHVVGGVDVERPTGPTRLDTQYALLSSRVSALLARSS